VSVTRVDLAALALYFVVIGIYGYYTRRSRTFSDYAVGGRAVPAMMVFASLAATIIGPGFSVGSTGKAYDVGFLFYFLCLPYALQNIVVGLFVAPRLTACRDCSTLGDIMRKSYGPFAHLLTGIISVGMLVGFTAVIGRIGADMLSEITGWSLAACLIAVTGTTALLTFTGGVRATIATEAVQFALFSIVVPIMLWVAIVKSPIGLEQISERATALTLQGIAGTSGIQMLGIGVSFMLGEALLPSYVNRALSATSEKGSRTGFVLSGSYVVVWLAIVGALGIVARDILPEGTVSDSVFVTLAQYVLPAGVYGLILAALVAIVMSSQEATLNSAAVSVVRDIVPFVAKLPDERSLFLAKLVTLALALLSIFIAQFSPSIIEGLLILYSIWAPTILVPLIAALFIRETKPLAGWLSIVCGGAASLLWQTALGEPAGIPAILVGLAASGAAYMAGHATGTRRSAP
jgi:SSS family solute:Na+ symporter